MVETCEHLILFAAVEMVDGGDKGVLIRSGKMNEGVDKLFLSSFLSHGLAKASMILPASAWQSCASR
jgi:hypothetical protein